MPDGNVTVSAVFEELPPSYANYTVKHLLQNIDDDFYTESEDDRQVVSGIAGDLTEAGKKTFTGFEVIPVTQAVIAEDGSTVVEIKYNRKTVSVTYDDGCPDEEIYVPAECEYRYGTTVYIDFTTGNRAGYSFGGFSDGTNSFTSDGDNCFVIGLSDVVLYACWSPSANTEYKVNHLLQPVSLSELVSDYEIISSDTQILTGTTGETVTPEPMDYTGFHSKTIVPAVIKADGSTVINIYYDRNKCTVQFDSNGGTGNLDSQSFYYGIENALFVNDSIIRENYNFAGWSLNSTAASVEYEDGQILSDFFEDDDTVLVLYSVWIRLNATAQTIGDIVVYKAGESNGTRFVPYNDYTKTLYDSAGWTSIGVVFNLADGKMLGLKQASKNFSGARSWVNSYSTAGYLKNWSLPWKQDLFDMYSNKTTLNNSLTKCGGTKLSNAVYWISGKVDSSDQIVNDGTINLSDGTYNSLAIDSTSHKVLASKRY